MTNLTLQAVSWFKSVRTFACPAAVQIKANPSMKAGVMSSAIV